MADTASLTRQYFNNITAANDAARLNSVLSSLNRNTQIPSAVKRALQKYAATKAKAIIKLKGQKRWPSTSSLYTGQTGVLGPIKKSGSARFINYDMAGAEKLVNLVKLGIGGPPSGITVQDVSENRDGVYVKFRVTNGGQRPPNVNTILNLIPSTPQISTPSISKSSVSTKTVSSRTSTSSITAALNQIKNANSVTTVNYYLTKFVAQYGSNPMYAGYVGMARSYAAKRIGELQKKTTTTTRTSAVPSTVSKQMATQLKSQIINQMNAASSIATLDELKTRAYQLYQNGQLEYSDYQIIGLAYSARRKAVAGTSTASTGPTLGTAAEKQLYMKYFNQIQSAQTINTLNQVARNYYNAYTSKQMNYSVFRQLETEKNKRATYINKLAAIKKQAQPILQETPKITTPSVGGAASYTIPVHIGGVETLEEISEILPEELPEIPETLMDIPTITDILGAPDLQTLSGYERTINTALEKDQISRTAYIPLSNAVSLRRDQLLSKEQAGITVPVAAEAEKAAPVISIVTQPQPQLPSQPLVITTPTPSASYPSAPTIITVPSQPAVATAPAQAAPSGPEAWAFNSPAEGPPLPRSLGIRWPWVKA